MVWKLQQKKWGFLESNLVLRWNSALGIKDLFLCITEKIWVPAIGDGKYGQETLLIKFLFFTSKNTENGVSSYDNIFLGVFRSCTDELVNTRGGWRRFWGKIGLDRKNMKKAVPQLTLMTFFYFCVRRINLFCISSMEQSLRKRAIKSGFVLFTLACFDEFFCKRWWTKGKLAWYGNTVAT